MTIRMRSGVGLGRAGNGQVANGKPPVRRPPAGGAVAGSTDPYGPSARNPRAGLATMTRRAVRYYQAAMRRMEEATDPAGQAAWREIALLADHVAVWACLQAYRMPKHRALLLAVADGALREADRRAKQIPQ